MITEHGELNGDILRPEYTFDNFIIGPENESAVNVAQAVARNPGGSWNPLILCAETGLGKTHLLHAIGNTILAIWPDAKIGWYTAEKILNHFISALRQARLDDFRRHFFSLDILLFDDLQFLAQKQHLRGEVLFIFKALLEAKKQIVIATDQFPLNIRGLGEQFLLCLEEGGLAVEMEVPAIQGRVEILQKRAEQWNISIPEDVAAYLAERIDTNIRELEGALIRIDAYTRLSGRGISVDLARDCLKRT